jgi:ribosomal protein L40E
MTRSATSTERAAGGGESAFRPWHFYILISMVGATVAVMLARDTHPVALLLLSSAVVAAGLVGLALHFALGGFLGVDVGEREPLRETEREVLEREKLLTLRSIKELEFDRDMGQVSTDMAGRLRARAMTLIEQLERAPLTEELPERAAPKPEPGVCAECGTKNDADARFCKQCGAQLTASGAA